MRYNEKQLFLERSGEVDVPVAGLIRTDLRIGSIRSKREDDPVYESFYDRLEMWLQDGTIQEVLSLSVEEVRICIGIMKSKIEISSETSETWTPNNVMLAKGLLPDMEEYVSIQDSPAE